LGNAFRKVRDIAGLDLHPLAPQVNLALAFEANHCLVRDVVIVSRAFLAGGERQNVNAFSLETVAGPSDQPSAHALPVNFNSIIQIADRAARPDLVVTPENARSIFRQP
jgi:hypothetical protein